MSRHAALRVGILGCAHSHAAGYARCLAQIEGAELAGLYDEERARADQIASAYGLRAEKSVEALLAKVDAVVVASENARSSSLVEAGASAGRPVLCEKPLGVSRKDSERMLEACASSGVSLGVSFPVRYSPAVIRLRELVSGGELGSTLSVWATNHGSFPGGWFGDPALSGGGSLIDHVVHVADLLRWVWGAEPISVFAEAAARHHGGISVEDAGLLLVTMDNATIVSLDASWSRHRGMPGAVDVTMIVTMDGGEISLDALSARVEHIAADGRLSFAGVGEDLDRLLLEDWIEAVRLGGPAPVPGEDGMRASALAWAALESARTYQTVHLPAVGVHGRAGSCGA